MLDPQREIQALVDNFVADLSDLAKRIAIAQVTAALGASTQVAAPPVRVPARLNRARRGPHEGPHEIEALRGKLLAAIAEQPGRRAEDINSALGTRTAQIAPPLRRLVVEHLVRTEGTRRGTRYFVVAPSDLPFPNGHHATSEASATVDEPPA